MRMFKFLNKQKHLFYIVLQLLMKVPMLQNIRILFYFYDKLILLFIKSKPKTVLLKKQILIVFPFALGDCIIFLGSIEHMRKVYSANDYTLHIMCQSGYEPLFTNYFDEVISFDYHRASISPFYRANMIKEMQKNYYDIVIDPIGCEECTPNVFSTNAVCATNKIGVISLENKKIQCPLWLRNKIYNKIIYNNNKNLHKIRFYTYIWEKLGNINCTVHPANLPSFFLRYRLPKNYFVVFPSASLPVKRWPAERFAEIARRVYKYTRKNLVVCGTKLDKEIIDGFLKMIPEIPVYYFVDKTSVTEFIEIIGRADLLITNDTSAYHIGVAKKIKVCIVTGGYVYDTFINYSFEKEACRKLAIVCKQRACFNCNNSCRYRLKKVYPCVEENTIEDVWLAVKGLINNE